MSIDLIRNLCLSHPDATERLSHGMPTWYIREKRSFASYAEHHHGVAHIALWCAAPEGSQAALVASDPTRFFVPPYVGHLGWLGVYLDVPIDTDEIAEIIAEAYNQVAQKVFPKRNANKP